MTNDRRWQAIVDRDKIADGLFFYAVITTGVLCRPSCSSRLPNRENVSCYASCEEALTAGYRPCTRCTPCAYSQDTDIERKIIRACRSIESSEPYDKRKDQLSMNPKVYKQGAEGVTITYGIVKSFLGWVIVAATEHGVCSIEFGDDPVMLPEQVQRRFPKAQLRKSGYGFASLIKDVVDCIESPEKRFDIPLDIQGTAFQQRVWSILRQIKPGETMSYTEVAEHIGTPRAVRAVATACAANKIAVIIPCHRVIAKDGKVSGYRWGIARKKLLLETEQPESPCGGKI